MGQSVMFDSAEESFHWASKTARDKTHPPRFGLSGCDLFRTEAPGSILHYRLRRVPTELLEPGERGRPD